MTPLFGPIFQLYPTISQQAWLKKFLQKIFGNFNFLSHLVALEFWPESLDSILPQKIIDERKIQNESFETRFSRIQKVFNSRNEKVVTRSEFRYGYAAVFTRYFNAEVPEITLPDWFDSKGDEVLYNLDL